MSIVSGKYYIVWVEGLNPKTGDKIHSIDLNSEEIIGEYSLRPELHYTSYMTKALRVRWSQVFDLMDAMEKQCGVKLTEADFIQVNYAPAGTVLKDQTLRNLKSWHIYRHGI